MMEITYEIEAGVPHTVVTYRDKLYLLQLESSDTNPTGDVKDETGAVISLPTPTTLTFKHKTSLTVNDSWTIFDEVTGNSYAVIVGGRPKC